MDDLIETQTLYDQLQGDQPPVVIDVRQAKAYRAGHIPGALHIRRDALGRKMAEIPRDRPVVTY
jgi:hydroxyacylglutathione hydrolase